MLRAASTSRVEPGAPRIDYAGSVLLTLGSVALLLGLLEGGVVWAWGSPASIALLVAAAVLLLSRSGRRAAGRRAGAAAVGVPPPGAGAAIAVSLVVGVILIGLTSYVPLFAQGVLGLGAVVAGFAARRDDAGLAHRRDVGRPVYLRLRLPPTC